MMPPKQVLTDNRSEVDAIDAKLVTLLNERALLVRHIAIAKMRDGQPLWDPEREKQVQANVARLNQGPLSNGALGEVFQRIMEEMLKHQEAFLKTQQPQA